MSATAAVHTPTQQSKWNQRQVRQMAAGGSAGIVAKTVVAPFERVKIVCQTGESVGMVQTTKVRRLLLLLAMMLALQYTHSHASSRCVRCLCRVSS